MAEMYFPPANVIDLSSEPDADLGRVFDGDGVDLPDPPDENDFRRAFGVDELFEPFGFGRIFEDAHNAVPGYLVDLDDHPTNPAPRARTPPRRYFRCSPTPPQHIQQRPPPNMASFPGSNYDTPIHVDDLEFFPLLSEDSCLQRVLEVLPDISHQHVRDLYNKAPPQRTDGDDWLQAFIGNIIETDKYPTERDAQRGLKRKREEEAAEPDFDKSEGDVDAADKAYTDASVRLLSAEFPELVQKHIKSRLKAHRTLYNTFGILEADNENDAFKLRTRRKRSRVEVVASSSSPPSSPTMPRFPHLPAGFDRPSKELQAAKKKSDKAKAKKREANAAALAEEENVRRAKAENAIQECGCCSADYPINRMVTCLNPDPEANHWLCYSCVKTYIETEIGSQRCKIVCIHMDGCTSTFDKVQLQRAVPQQLLEKLGKLQQHNEIRLAMEDGGLDGLDECPFCDFKAICPPKEVDREFRCKADGCGIVSCRLCRQETHIPLTCEESAKDKGINARHVVEEAMTEALVRSCNKCKNKFIKEMGCNKMTCPTCHNAQCYVCSENVKDYNHFSDASHLGATGKSRKKCPLYDDVHQRHAEEVKKAEENARKKVTEENPGLTEEELKIKVSDRVKEAEQQGRYMHGPPGAPLGIFDGAADRPRNLFVQLPYGHARPRRDVGYIRPVAPVPPPLLPGAPFPREQLERQMRLQQAHMLAVEQANQARIPRGRNQNMPNAAPFREIVFHAAPAAAGFNDRDRAQAGFGQQVNAGPPGAPPRHDAPLAEQQRYVEDWLNQRQQAQAAARREAHLRAAMQVMPVQPVERHAFEPVRYGPPVPPLFGMEQGFGAAIPLGQPPPPGQQPRQPVHLARPIQNAAQPAGAFNAGMPPGPQGGVFPGNWAEPRGGQGDMGQQRNAPRAAGRVRDDDWWLDPEYDNWDEFDDYV